MKLNNRNIALISLAVILLFLLICYLQFARDFNARSKLFYNNNVNSSYIDYLADEFGFNYTEDIEIYEAIELYPIQGVVLLLEAENLNVLKQKLVTVCNISPQENIYNDIFVSDYIEDNIKSINYYNEFNSNVNINDCILNNNSALIPIDDGNVVSRMSFSFIENNYFIIIEKRRSQMNDENKFKQILKDGRYYRRGDLNSN
ncbi:hypothetical protein FACS189499_05210 [Clostridia bacterium]|nr:hypothetical protein FACS189499_05210 [Clostridia bacterium]